MLKHLDFFPKVLQDQPIRYTICGGLLYVCTLLLAVTLVVNEVVLAFTQVSIQQHVKSDGVDERVRVNLNITLHDVPCAVLSLDYQDVTGTQLEDVRYSLHKLRIRGAEYVDANLTQKIAHKESQLFPSTTPLNLSDCHGSNLVQG